MIKSEEIDNNDKLLYSTEKTELKDELLTFLKNRFMGLKFTNVTHTGGRHSLYIRVDDAVSAHNYFLVHELCSVYATAFIKGQNLLINMQNKARVIELETELQQLK
jgi:hypothetical protein